MSSHKVGMWEFEWKTTIGSVVCRMIGHARTRSHGRCGRCLRLLPGDKK